MSDVLGVLTGGAVLLGNMVLTGFEVPERIHYGGQHQLTIHKLPGGARVFDAMGDDPAPIEWRGTFLGLGCQERRSELEDIRTAGQPVELAFSDASFLVLVASVEYDEGFQQIGYRIRCEVRPDESDDDAEDPSAYGTGETPTTPAAAKDTGQGAATKARSAGSSIPKRAMGGSTRPVGDFDPQSTSFA